MEVRVGKEIDTQGCRDKFVGTDTEDDRRLWWG